jgi:DNA-binding LacI/PurR family transcriptional regulator
VFERRGSGGAVDGQGEHVASVIEVAKLAGVSRQTVSNVLNAPERVAQSTRERVEAAIAELGYQPDRNARNLQARRAHLIGIDLRPSGPDEVSPVLDRFLHALTEEAAKRGYHVLVFPRTDDPASSHLPLHATRAVDGFVLVDTHPEDRRVEVLAEKGVPFVTFGATGGSFAHDVVDVDGHLGGRLAALEALRNAASRPAFVGWPDGSLVGDARLAGFLEAVGEAGIDTAQVPVARSVNRVEAGVQATLDLLRSDTPPDAIVAVSDLLAVGVVRALRSLDLRAGRDVRVVGFDDAPIAAHLDPPLTTVGQPVKAVAQLVVERFLARLDAPDAPVTTDLLDPHLVVRQT